jgi:2-C-methyl-D-erythritol 2,4-cyclodiphosphate synthase
MYRIGFGIDFHQLVEDREFWLGGIKIPHTKGALGHSDADVLLHAICDAMLGALALGDIGVHFPQEGYSVVNVDSSLCLEAPKIKKYVPEMQAAIANILQLTIKDVSIKATTTEKMGFVGREEGLVAYATVLLQKTS